MTPSSNNHVVFSKEEKQQYRKIKAKADTLYDQFLNAYAMLILEHARKRQLPWISRTLAQQLLPEAVAKFPALIIYDDGINHNDSRDYRQVKINGLADQFRIADELHDEALYKIRVKQHWLKMVGKIKERTK